MDGRNLPRIWMRQQIRVLLLRLLCVLLLCVLLLCMLLLYVLLLCMLLLVQRGKVGTSFALTA